MIDIQTLNLTWSESVNVRTSRGARSLRVAEPNPSFWAAWRSNKSALTSAGISCRKNQYGEWEVCEWSDVPVTQDFKPQEVLPVSPSIAEPVRPAAKLEEFSAPPLDTAKNWSAEQNAIFEYARTGTGNLVVQARAGTGKTTTIKAMFSQCPEAEMLYAVFNKKNQIEAQNSITDARVEIKTLHAVGYKLIRSVWSTAKPDDDVEFDRVEQVVSRNAPDEVAGAVRKLVGFAKNMFVAPTIDDLLDLMDCRGIEVSELFEADGWTPNRLANCAMQVLELSKQRDPAGRISFNDMVWLPVAMGWVRASYDLVVVDEAQDMNLPQLLMAIGLSRGRIVVVGDDRQAIYGFRGAAQDGMNLMRSKLQASVLPLTITYRCPKAVVALAAEIVPDYRAAGAAPAGEVKSMGDSIILESAKIGDAILSRANAPLMPLCLQLLRRGVSARIEGRDIGKTLAAIVRKINADSVPRFIEKVAKWADRQKARCRGSKHFESKAAVIDDQAACLTAVAEGVSSVSEIEPRLLSLFQDSDGFQKPAVVLSSVHKAKGLEWNRVFLLTKTFKQSAKEGEEANIYYVAVTRAKSELVLVSEDKKAENN